ncbi:MAG: tRNA uridine-5-carboxymethylaminomethyl(34) synthesis enzyme MnmG, partial [Firmicutes bacterium]|nr:tRNA uridine-5-carboxymethylaminomethyl(34) synthesis enzyme MnmG [Bacillota bacterium]
MKRDSVDLGKLEVQYGEVTSYTFSTASKKVAGGQWSVVSEAEREEGSGVRGQGSGKADGSNITNADGDKNEPIGAVDILPERMGNAQTAGGISTAPTENNSSKPTALPTSYFLLPTSSAVPHSSLLTLRSSPPNPEPRIPNPDAQVCYLGYTNPSTHRIIADNLSKSPKYAGLIKGAGARYCPSVEDKIVRFADKERHPFFLEPEGAKTQEMYVQGLSTGLPADVQLKLYRSIEGFENVQIMRDAYAIEYECIDPTELFATLQCKRCAGLFFAGQINGTSGYEEAAAQGVVAGINAARFLRGEPGLILPRESSYTGVLIDDLVTKGTDEPYRMMTSRAEYRLLLRQDNADLRMEEFARLGGILGKERLDAVAQKRAQIELGKKRLEKRLSQKAVTQFFERIGEPAPQSGLTVSDVIRRNLVTFENFTA